MNRPPRRIVLRKTAENEHKLGMLPHMDTNVIDHCAVCNPSLRNDVRDFGRAVRSTILWSLVIIIVLPAALLTWFVFLFLVIFSPR